MDAYVSSVVRLPKEGVDVTSVKRELTIKVWDHINEQTNHVEVFREVGEYLQVPRYIGLHYITQYELGCVYETSLGFKSFQDSSPVSLWDYQVPWVDEAFTKLHSGYLDLSAMAATGKGKTVMSLEIARRLGRTTLVFVDQEFLRDQWKDNAKKFLGLRDEDIGTIQGTICDYLDKSLVVAMVQTLYNRQYPDEVYKYFGTVIFDESHTLGAEQFSNVLMQFPAEYRLAVSATPDRTDELQKVLEYNLGPVRVELKDQHTKSSVRYVEYDGVISWYANISPKAGRYINELVSDSRRNELLSRIIVYLHNTGRPTLVVSDRIEHLEHLMALCYYQGVPKGRMGLVAGYCNTWAYAKDPTPLRKPYGLSRGVEYTPVKMQLVKKRIPNDVLTHRKSEAEILFATYGKFNKGVDVPRLAAGVDCSPRAKAVQVHGRILRKHEGKKVPLWVTIRDIMSYKAEYQFSKRLVEYIKSNAEILQWRLGKGTRKREVKGLRGLVNQRIAKLKQAEIVTDVDGNYTVVTKSTGRRSNKEVEKPTAGRTLRKRSRIAQNP